MIKFEPAKTRMGRDVRRASVRHGWSHVLECVSIAARLTDGDLVHGIILMAIIHANTAPLRLSSGDNDYDMAVNLPDDDLRTPVSVYAVAKQLGMPYETVRRHVGRLIEEGRCIRSGPRGGVLVPTQAILLLRPDVFLSQSLESLGSLLSALDRIGAIHHQNFHDSDRANMII